MDSIKIKKIEEITIQIKKEINYDKLIKLTNKRKADMILEGYIHIFKLGYDEGYEAHKDEIYEKGFNKGFQTRNSQKDDDNW